MFSSLVLLSLLPSKLPKQVGRRRDNEFFARGNSMGEKRSPISDKDR